MTTTLAEVEQTDQDGLTPAQQALAVALAFATAAEAGVEQRVLAWLAGRISRVDLCYSSAQVVLQAVAKATLAGEHFAELEWQHRATPKVIASTEHERLVRVFDVITKDAQQARGDAVAESLRSLAQPEVSKEFVEPETSETLRMRATRIASAETIKAERTGYAEAVAQAVGDDPDYVWAYVTDTDPCARCVTLAALSFQSFEQAPRAGAHISCACTLECRLKG